MLAGFSVFDVLRYMQRAAKAIGINRCASEKEVLLVKVVSFLQDSSGSDMAIVAFSCYCSKLISKNASSTSQVTVHRLRRQCSELLIIVIVTVKTTYTAYLQPIFERTWITVTVLYEDNGFDCAPVSEHCMLHSQL